MATRKPKTQDDVVEPKGSIVAEGDAGLTPVVEPEVQDDDETPPDSTDVQDAPADDEGITEPHVERGASTASHRDPQGHPVTIAPALHAYHEARGYTPITG